MTDSISTAGETTSIGIPTITVVPVTVSGDRPFTDQDLDTINHLKPGTAILLSTRNAVMGARYLLDEDKITVGRDPKSDIMLDDGTVSRHHAVFTRTDGKYSIEDVGSLNGTYVNRQRVDKAELKSGDELVIGRFRLVFFGR